MKKVNRNITEEEDSSQCLKFLTQSTIKDDIAPLSGIQKVYPIPGRSLDKLISHLQCFWKDQQRKRGSVFETDIYIPASKMLKR